MSEEIKREEKADVVEKRKESLKIWLKKPANVSLIFVLIFAFVIRLYYFFLTNGQTIWWDEAEYMSNAKMWAFGVPYDLNPQRPPLFQFLAAILFKIGLGEQFIKFSLVLVPSLFLVFAVYLLGKEMFNEKIGLICAFLTSVSWTLIFWGARIQPDYFSMSFQVLSIFFMWKYWKNNKGGLIMWAGFFAALGFYFKVSGLLVPLSFFVFILLKDRLSALKNKHYYLFVISFLATLIPYFIWAYLTFGTSTAFKAGYSAQVTSSAPFAWYNLDLFYALTENVLFILFIIGSLLALKFLLYSDVLLKDKKKIFDPNIFSILVLVIVTAFYVFYIRAAQDRWVFLWLPFMFFLVGNALIFIYENIKKYNKNIAIIVVGVLVLWGAYIQLNHADDLVKVKKDSYQPVQLAALWMKQNSNPNDVILSMSRPQTTYYAEREVYHQWHEIGKENLEEFLVKRRPKYITISAFENHNEIWTSWISENQNRLMPVQAYFADQEQKNPLLIVYEIKYENNNIYNDTL